MRNFLRAATAVGLLTMVTAASASAEPISFTTLLTGDPRPDSPDNITVRVTVNTDASDDTITYWTVDLDMAAYHPDARLDEFGFNLVAPSSQYSFSNFSLPYTTTSGALNGSGGASFMLTLDDPSGNASDANNVTSLSFTLTKTSAFTMDDFLNAPTSCSGDSFIGCNQLGAHLVALGPTGADGGVAVGGYGTNPVPEPASMVLLGSGAVAAAVSRRRRKVDA